MATNGNDLSRYLDRDLMEQLMFGIGHIRRFTQDSPVLPDVWFEYALDPEKMPDRMTRVDPGDGPHPAVNLILTPYRTNPPGEVRVQVQKQVEAERRKAGWKMFKHKPKPYPRVIYNQTSVEATLYFEDLVRAVIPMTKWWQVLLAKGNLNPAGVQDPVIQKQLADALMDPEHPPSNKLAVGRMSPAALWLIRVVGAIAIKHRGEPLPEVFEDRRQGPSKAEPEDWLPIVKAVAALLRDVGRGPVQPQIYSVALNRVGTLSISGSTLAVKADAARTLFAISCKELTWAIIDSGVDAKHPAFREKKAEEEKNEAKKRKKGSKKKEKTSSADFESRVTRTYDFSRVRDLLDPDSKARANMKAELRRRGAKTSEIEGQVANVEDMLSTGRALDWGALEPFLRIAHDEKYPCPQNDHGTHVAGILAADWEAATSGSEIEDDLVGVCPDIRLYDLRILDKDKRFDEFTVMAALQFVRWLNSTNDYMAVHGVNMSLSIRHDVANYACGRTPVCEEAARVVSSGVVVVAAAGNEGFRKYTSPEGFLREAYNTISITDPGNADAVITVGATHRVYPHTFGVSYFSSRGPTGDGRLKPDLVAPGEKITSPLPRGIAGVKDGTSMAAPHVSGAAALLMARHQELKGQPGRIKEILCRTATDLGRERYFQGAGMLDVLRAIQSV